MVATGKGRPGPPCASRSGWQSLGAQNQFLGYPLLPDHPSCSSHCVIIPCLTHSAPSLTGDDVGDVIIHPCVLVHGGDSQHNGALWGHGHQGRTCDISSCPQTLQGIRAPKEGQGQGHDTGAGRLLTRSQFSGTEPE